MTVYKRARVLVGLVVAVSLNAVVMASEEAAKPTPPAHMSFGIHTVENAKSVADVWLKFGRIQGVKTGMVHDLRLAYVVEIVREDSDGTLVNLLIIRSVDGFTQLVY